MTRSPLWVVAGPTASGKSALALELAERLGAEIVGADSQQLYRGFSVGTAQPSPEDLARVPHHLVGTLDPRQQCSAAAYQRLADAAIADIEGRGKPVVVCGGTGLYLRVLLRGVVEAPSADPALRAELEAFADEKGNQALHRRLADLDPVSAGKLHPADRVRLVRAVEIATLTGKAPSALREAHAFAEPRHPHRLLVLSPPAEALREVIARRTRAMFEGGLLPEVRGLLEQGLREAAPMRSVGYVQALGVLDGRYTLEQAIALATHATAQYAKRQRTWFRKEPGAQWLEPPVDVEQLVPG